MPIRKNSFLKHYSIPPLYYFVYDSNDFFFQVVYNNYQSECALHLKSVMKTICEFSGNIALYARGTLGFPLIARSIISNFKNIYICTCTIFICEQYSMMTIHRNEMQVQNKCRYIEVAASSSLLELFSWKIHNF